MTILIAEDEPISRRILQANLEKWGHEVIACEDGLKAWEILQRPDAPSLVILDWMMPNLDGVELCKKIRSLPHGELAYIILLTAKTARDDVVHGLNAGANDYVTKPPDHAELQARVRVGERVIELQERLIEAERNRVLAQAAGAAAHEINQPLTVLVGTTELMMYQMDADAKQRENLEALHQASKRISEIVKKMGEIRQYVTKPYLEGIDIIDLDRSTKTSDLDA